MTVRRVSAASRTSSSNFGHRSSGFFANARPIDRAIRRRQRTHVRRAVDVLHQQLLACVVPLNGRVPVSNS